MAIKKIKLHTIYKLSVGDYWYIGRTKNAASTRWKSHKKSCFNTRKSTAYRSKIYRTFRMLGVKRNNWDTMVKKQVVYKCLPQFVEYYEYAMININCPHNVNTASKIVKEIYEKQIAEWGLYTPEQIKENVRLSNAKWNKENAEKRKAANDKWMKDNEVLWKKTYTNNNLIQNKKKYFCNCCNKEMLKTSKYRHEKKVKHCYNSLMFIE